MNSTQSLVSVADAAAFQAEVLAPSQDTLVLVDFWAAWCGPCKALAPILDEVASTQAGRVRIVKVDVDSASDLAAEYGVRALPTLALFKGGELVSQLVGLQSAPAIEAMLTDAGNGSAELA
jgi:thioredoxin 1